MPDRIGFCFRRSAAVKLTIGRYLLIYQGTYILYYIRVPVDEHIVYYTEYARLLPYGTHTYIFIYYNIILYYTPAYNIIDIAEELKAVINHFSLAACMPDCYNNVI